MHDRTVTDLARLDLHGLERLYREASATDAPRGLFRGRFLARIPNPGSGRLPARAVQLCFRLPRFGIDFDRRLWWFVHPAVRMGRFEASPGRSRWRDTDAILLRYRVSRLPGVITRGLYDEVKPLSESLALGIGGVNAGRGEGDYFFFSLERLRSRSC